MYICQDNQGKEGKHSEEKMRNGKKKRERYMRQKFVGPISKHTNVQIETIFIILSLIFGKGITTKHPRAHTMRVWCFEIKINNTDTNLEPFYFIQLSSSSS